ncbi:hypothetical protein HAX54_040195, partial [Datura stramonium]|nr:hypothetical protein [Datura stramonium]
GVHGAPPFAMEQWRNALLPAWGTGTRCGARSAHSTLPPVLTSRSLDNVFVRSTLDPSPGYAFL